MWQVYEWDVPGSINLVRDVCLIQARLRDPWISVVICRVMSLRSALRVWSKPITKLNFGYFGVINEYSFSVDHDQFNLIRFGIGQICPHLKQKQPPEKLSGGCCCWRLRY